jgi:hypothetical protein
MMQKYTDMMREHTMEIHEGDTEPQHIVNNDLDDDDEDEDPEEEGLKVRRGRKRKDKADAVYNLAASANTPAISKCINSRLFKWNKDLVRTHNRYKPGNSHSHMNIDNK